MANRATLFGLIFLILFQQVFNPWIKPSEKVVSAYHQYRSSTGTIYGSYQTNDDNNEYKHCWQELPHHQQQQQRQREDFIPSYEPTTAHFVDPWEAYLQRQEQEELMRRKHEEERLYYQYLNDLRMQERNNHVECEHLPANQTNLLHNQHLAQHDFHLHQSTDQHDHDHVSHHHDENAFQHTDQWIDKMTRYHQASDDGHWESTADQVTDLGRQDLASFHASGDAAAGGHQPSSRIVEQEKKTIDGDTGHNNLVMHDTKPQMCPIIAQQEPTHSTDGHCVIGKTEVVDGDNRMGEAVGTIYCFAEKMNVLICGNTNHLWKHPTIPSWTPRIAY